ncbi:hypothetical protein HMI55_000970, partial [Coelomomyces lativittatus]
MSSVSIHPIPLMQALCHAYKYTHLPVCGLFLGPSSFNAKGETTSTSDPDGQVISHCIPLLHSTLSITLWMDIAIDQIRGYLQDPSHASSLKVIGFYYANDTAFQKNEEMALQILRACSEDEELSEENEEMEVQENQKELKKRKDKNDRILCK